MFCQSCGQKNIDDARFCNFCGDRIAAPGSPGGRTDIAPSASASVSEQWGPGMTLGDSLALSLAGIGIKTPGRAYGLILVLALALMSAGGIIVYSLAQSGEAPSADSGHASPGDTFLVGAPIPEGLDLPPFPEEPSNAPVDARPSPAPSPPAARESRGDSPRGSSSPQSTQAPSPPPAAQPAPAPESPPSTPSPAPAAHAPPPKPEETPAAPSEPAPPAPKNPEAEMELELYAGRVRFAVSRYYAAATQSCFDKATQKDATLSGTVVIATKVGADGQVQSASPARNSTGDQSLGECLASQVRSFRLPPPPSGEIELKLPFSR